MIIMIILPLAQFMDNIVCRSLRQVLNPNHTGRQPLRRTQSNILHHTLDPALYSSWKVLTDSTAILFCNVYVDYCEFVLNLNAIDSITQYVIMTILLIQVLCYHHSHIDDIDVISVIILLEFNIQQICGHHNLEPIYKFILVAQIVL